MTASNRYKVKFNVRIGKLYNDVKYISKIIPNKLNKDKFIYDFHLVCVYKNIYKYIYGNK